MKTLLQSLLTSACLIPLAAAFPAYAQAETVLPPLTAADAPPATWPAPPRPAADAPSVLVIMTDDVGFGASSTFGGPVPTAAFDALAADGLRYNQFHTTGICSPTRAALLTGRNHHAVEVATVSGWETGYDGYRGAIPKSAATVAELLRRAGYGTGMFGKAHITPGWETGPAGPFDRWPTGLGFEYFYGFMGGDTNQWAPALVENTRRIDPPYDDPSYILDRDLADRAIGWIQDQRTAAPDRPLFLYFAPGTAHAPHHAPAEWISKFKGQFDAGWDKMREETLARQKKMGVVPADAVLAARPPVIPAWKDLTSEQQRVYAHQMEVYAAALAFADHQIGRVIAEARKRLGPNLMVVYVQGDNGSSAEGGLHGAVNEGTILTGVEESFDYIRDNIDKFGGPHANNTFSAGWAFALSTPFPWFKQLASYFGATRNGLAISWPGHVPAGGDVRAQFHHITDIMPTILEAAQVKLPDAVDGVKQQPLNGVSMRYSFNNASAPTRHKTQYFTVWDNLGLYDDGWLLSTVPESMPWRVANMAPVNVKNRQWQLFNVTKDFSTAHDVAKRYPAVLEEMKRKYFAEAVANNVLPIHRTEGVEGRPAFLNGKTEFELFAGSTGIVEANAPSIRNRSYSISATLSFDEGGGDGVILTQGGRFGGWTLYMKDQRPVFHYNFASIDRFTIAGTEAIAPGNHVISANFDYDGGGSGKGGTLTLLVDGAPVASGRIDRTMSRRHSIDETMDVGRDTGTPASEDYAMPGTFRGEIAGVTIKLR